MNIKGWKPPKRKLSALAVIGGGLGAFGMGMANAWARSNDAERDKFPDWFKNLHKTFNPKTEDVPEVKQAEEFATPPLVEPSAADEHAQAWSEEAPEKTDTFGADAAYSNAQDSGYTMPDEYETPQPVDLAGGV